MNSDCLVKRRNYLIRACLNSRAIMFSEIESEGVSARQSGCIKVVVTVNNNWCDVGSRLINPPFGNHLTNTWNQREGRRADADKKKEGIQPTATTPINRQRDPYTPIHQLSLRTIIAAVELRNNWRIKQPAYGTIVHKFSPGRKWMDLPFDLINWRIYIVLHVQTARNAKITIFFWSNRAADNAKHFHFFRPARRNERSGPVVVKVRYFLQCWSISADPLAIRWMELFCSLLRSFWRSARPAIRTFTLKRSATQSDVNEIKDDMNRWWFNFIKSLCTKVIYLQPYM